MLAHFKLFVVTATAFMKILVLTAGGLAKIIRQIHQQLKMLRERPHHRNQEMHHGTAGKPECRQGVARRPPPWRLLAEPASAPCAAGQDLCRSLEPGCGDHVHDWHKLAKHILCNILLFLLCPW